MNYHSFAGSLFLYSYRMGGNVRCQKFVQIMDSIPLEPHPHPFYIGGIISAKEVIELNGGGTCHLPCGWRSGLSHRNQWMAGSTIDLQSMAANHRFPFNYLEHRPVYSGAPLLLSNLSQMPKQRFANPEPPGRFPHIEVLEVYPWLARPRREVEEVESKTDWLM